MDARSKLSRVKEALLQKRLEGASRRKGSGPAIPARPDRGSAPLTATQRQMWFIDQMTPGNPAYNLPYGFHLRGRLDPIALEVALNEIVKRHESLRTTIDTQAGEPVQRIHPELEIGIRVTALDHLDDDEREARLEALASQESLHAFHLSRLPLIRAHLLELGDDDHVLVVNLHHIVADGLSIGLLMNELDQFYRAHTGGTDARPPELAVQYGDFAAWQRDRLSNEDSYRDQLEFWRTKLGGPLPVLELLADRSRPSIQSFRGSNVFFDISANLAKALKDVGADERCTAFMTLLAAFQVLLQRFSGAEDLIIGTPVANRVPVELEPLIGNFLNMVSLRCDLSGDPTFADVLGRSRDTTLDACSNVDVPLETIMKRLEIVRDPSRNPVFQTLFELQSPRAPGLGDLDVSDYRFDLGFAQFDLSLHLYEDAGSYRGRFEYCTDLFERETVERLAAAFELLLRAVAAEPNQRISQLPILPALERKRILDDWNSTAAECPRAAFPELFETQAESTPQRIAVRAGGESLTYAQLDARANRLANTLQARGAWRGQRIGLCVERGIDMLAAMLGILKAGAAYVPLDPSFPEARLRFMTQDAQLGLLVSRAALADVCGMPRGRQLLLDDDAQEIAAAPDHRPAPAPGGPRAEDPAYVIYTSGSTGTPKGVVVPHRAVVNFLSSMAREPGLDADDVLVAVTTLSFDIAVLELLLPLMLGATVVVASRDEAMDPAALGLLLDRHGATVMQATPVTWRMLLQSGWRGRIPFKALVGGETLSADLARQLIDRGVELWNMYGPTETTVWSTCARITDAAGITIGRPIANTVVRVLDAQRNLCPVGVAGELCIGGVGVALGYWQRPDLGAERFIVDPFAADSKAMLYRTGDRARWRADGMLEHLGRLDFQVKLRGFRIETGEVEAGIAGHPAVREAAVVAREDIAGDRQLVAYVVAGGASGDLADQLRAQLRAIMPQYMVPTRFVMLDALPRTQNGKLDRKALPAPDAGGQPGRRATVTPRTDTEQTVIEVFHEVLKRNDFGVEDNFFDLGGTSLMAARIVMRLRSESGRDLPLRNLFERPTAAALAEALDALEWAAMSREPMIADGDRVEIEL